MQRIDEKITRISVSASSRSGHTLAPSPKGLKPLLKVGLITEGNAGDPVNHLRPQNLDNGASLGPLGADFPAAECSRVETYSHNTTNLLSAGSTVQSNLMGTVLKKLPLCMLL